MFIEAQPERRPEESEVRLFERSQTETALITYFANTHSQSFFSIFYAWARSLQR